jgi:hypothetical protein
LSLVCLVLLEAVAGAEQMTMTSQARYLGTPDLALTSAVLAVGGGPASFRSKKLIGALAPAYAGYQCRPGFRPKGER